MESKFVFKHKPVLLGEIQEAMAWKEPIAFWDATVGLGGHSFALLSANPAPSLYVASDQDDAALKEAEKKLKSILKSETLSRFMNLNFSAFAANPLQSFDRILVDLGVSSYQLDDARRGFSFQKEGPLDMRMNSANGEAVGTWLMHCDYETLKSVFRENEVSQAGLFTKRWMEGREKLKEKLPRDFASQPLTTKDFVEALGFRLDSKDRRGRHPLTLVFQALRIFINREREHLEILMKELPRLLNPGGLVAIITFHSQEDRLVKWSLKGRLEPINKKVIIASEEEQAENPRSRSAKLRVYRRDA